MEKETTIKVPDPYLSLLEDIRLLQSDQNNPNVTTIRQQDQIWMSLQKYGWTYPILTNKNGLLVDGEQRTEICKQHGEFFAPVLRLPVTDLDRRMLRQILNKLKGKHNKELDAAEYMRIVEAGERDCLKTLLASVGEKLPQDLLNRELSVSIPATYEIIVECRDESDQKSIFEKLKLEGYKLRILTL
ncbi:MAG: ParB/RepB/Spo0J family partition protein [Candidatus Bathyarchaeia archaeon]|jgi:ParB-like chromosome segregation protein Spo0J